MAHGDAASDLPATLLALDATFVIRGASGTRAVPAAEFFKSIFETAIEPGELLTEIQVPKPAAPSAWSFQKFTKRAIDWAIVGVAVQGVVGRLDQHGPDPAARVRRRVGARVRRILAEAAAWPPRAPRPASTSTPARPTASTWPAFWSGAAWRKRRRAA